MSRGRHRIGWMFGLVVGLAGIAGLGAVAAVGDKTLPSAPSEGEFSILTERNIFLSTRVAPKRRSIVVTPTPAEDVWVVRGVFSRGGTCVALCENTATGATRVVGTGETVGALEITAVSLDGVAVRGGDQTRRVSVGRTLVGGQVAVSVPRKTPARSPGDVDAKSILERLRQRRRQEISEQSKSPAQSFGSERTVKMERK